MTIKTELTYPELSLLVRTITFKYETVCGTCRRIKKEISELEDQLDDPEEDITDEAENKLQELRQYRTKPA